jgi:hypothetical protein
MPKNPSALAAAIEAYMRAKGFHPTGDTGYWGHPQLGEGRDYWTCVQWQIGREIEGSDHA